MSGVVAAQIVSVENHPESHKLHLLKVDAGDGQLTDVVCGAPNVQLGMKTAFAKVGAQLGDITISPRKLAGYTSYGMCCSEKEIGISDDNSGIMVLPEDVPCGTDLKALYPIDDIIFEVDNKSLTNRPDLWGTTAWRANSPPCPAVRSKPCPWRIWRRITICPPST